MMGWGWNGWGFGLMGLLMIVFWGGIIWLIVWGISRLTRHEAYHGADKKPLDIARERYAKGEITKEQFDQIKKDLNG
jgi:putative membrane protein